MDIVYSIDDRFIPQAAALSASILEQSRKAGSFGNTGFLSQNVIFHFLSNGITAENQERFRAFARSLGAEAVFYDLGDFEGRLERILGARPETGRFVKAALGRIFAPDYLPPSVHRYLYLDADMTALGDLSELFRLDLQGKVLAAAAEPTIYAGLTAIQTGTETGGTAGGVRSLRDQAAVRNVPEKTGTAGSAAAGSVPEERETAGRNAPTGRSAPTGRNAPEAVQEAYFNTGLLLVDRDAWDREGITRKCLCWYAEHNGTFDFADQDILNRVLAGRILPLSQRWNFQTNYHYRSWRSLVKQSPWYAALCPEEEYEAARRRPALVHYAGDERPWIAGNRNPYRKEYVRTLALTPWKDTPQTGGKEAYMCFYHAVNVLSALIPGFRRAVSEVYYRTCRKGKKGR